MREGLGNIFGSNWTRKYSRIDIGRLLCAKPSCQWRILKSYNLQRSLKMSNIARYA